MSLPVLVVEDDDDLREALVDTLQLGGYATVAADNGLSALQILEHTRVGQVLRDVQMQPMDGNSLLREIKIKYPWGRLPLSA